MAKHHKSKAGEEEGCRCNDCPLRFQCFTQERVFSDSLLQGLFEAIMAEGFDKEEALKQVKSEIAGKLNQRDAYRSIAISHQPFEWDRGVTTPTTPWQQFPYTTGGGGTRTTCNQDSASDYTFCNDLGFSTSDVHINDCGKLECSVSYTMSDGKEYKWCTYDAK